MKEPTKPSDFYAVTGSTIMNHYKKIVEKTDKQVKEELSLRLKLYRSEHQLTLEGLAKLVGVSKLQVIRWEQMRSKPNQLAMAKLKELKIL